MTSLLVVEFEKLFRRWQTYLGYAVLLLIMGLTLWATYSFKQHMGSNMMPAGQGLTVVGSPATDTFFTYWALTSASWLVVLFSVYVAGNTLAGEWSSGSLRTLLVRPVRRSAVVAAKWLVSSVYALSLIVVLVGGSLLAGWAVLGHGDLFVANMRSMAMGQKILIMPAGMALRRFALAAGLLFVWAEALVGLALLASAALKSGPAALVITLGLMITMVVIGIMPFDLFAQWKPYFLTSYYLNWQSGFKMEIDWLQLLRENYYVLVYLVVSVAGAFAIFSRRDILA